MPLVNGRYAFIRLFYSLGGFTHLKVVFLDRDGVINQDIKDDYVRNEGQLVFLPGSLESIARLNQAGITVFVISNQAGVGRGLFNLQDLDRINKKLISAVTEYGGEISRLYYCLHRKDEGCECRKPDIGLLKQASQEHGFELEGTYFIGDSEKDVIAGFKAGCKTILVLSGSTKLEDTKTWECKPDYIAADLSEAADLILNSISTEYV